jgi:DNA-binding transcriptional MerR regulator
MKISELVERTGVPKETIHYYLREGVLRKPRKGTKNSADYNESYVDQIRIIKKLQEHYFLPLSVIKKIIRQHQKQTSSEKYSFNFLSEYFRPLDRLITVPVTGRDTFREITGLSNKWQTKFEEWGVIGYELRAGEPVYSSDDVILSKLIVGMDQLGFGPKDGYKPEDLRVIADFVRKYVKRVQKDFYQTSLARLSPEEIEEKTIKFMEVMSLFFYHLYRKVVLEEYGAIFKSKGEEIEKG